MIIFKKKPIVVDCFTTKDYVIEHNPIAPASQFMPKWMSDMPSTYKADGFIPAPTMKRCPAVVGMMTQGFMIPLWCDLVIGINPLERSFRWQFADEETNAKPHNVAQWEAFANPTVYGHLKIIAPWYIQTKNKVDFLWTNPFFNVELGSKYKIIPAITEYKHQHAANINMFIDKSEEGDILIKSGTPMAHIIPMTDKEVKIKTHLVDSLEYRKLRTPSLFFINNYKKLIGK